MSLNVGATFWAYQGRSRSTRAPAWPLTAYHSTVNEPTNHAIGCARSTLRSLHTLGSCRPRYCLLSKNAGSILHLRQYPWMTNAAETVGSVATNTSSRHWPSGSRTRTTATGSTPQPVYHRTSRTIWTRTQRSSLGKPDRPQLGGVHRRVLDHRQRRRQSPALLRRPPLTGVRPRPLVQCSIPPQRPEHLEVLGAALDQLGVDVRRVADQPERPLGQVLGQVVGQFGSQPGAALVTRLPLLAIAPPEHGQAVVAVGAQRQRYGDAEHDPVEAEPKGLVLLGREHGVEEDAAEGDLGPPRVAEGVIDDDPDDPARDEVGQDQRGRDEAQVVPLPDRRVEDGVGGVVMPLGRQPGGEPDLADGPGSLADNPAGEEGLEGLEDLGVEAVGARRYQGSERGNKLVHGAGLGAAGYLES